LQSGRVTEWRDQMRAVCERHGSEVVAPSLREVAGVADNLESGAWPLNGLRHRVGSTSGWFLWAGDNLSAAADFFKPLHLSHLQERCPEVMPYLGLAPGYRFLVALDYEDVWVDRQLLEHEV
jgi:hypothetical protein